MLLYMRLVATLCTLAIISANSWGTQRESSIPFEDFSTLHQHLSKQSEGLSRLDKQTLYHNLLSTVAKDLGLEVVNRPILVPGSFFTFGSYTRVLLPGTQPGLTGIHIALLDPETHGVGTDPALGPSIAISLMHSLTMQTNRPNIALILLGGQYEDNYWGTKAWASAWSGELPQQIFYGYFPSLTQAIDAEIHQGPRGFSSDGLAGILRSAMPPLELNAPPSQYWASLKQDKEETPTHHNPYTKLSIPHVILRTNNAPNKPFETNLGYNYVDTLRNLALSPSPSGKSNFLYLSQDPLVLISEKLLLITTLVGMLLYLILAWFARSRFSRGFFEVIKYSGDYFVFILTLMATSGIVWVFLRAPSVVLQRAIWWDIYPLGGFFVFVLAILGLFSFILTSPIRRYVLQTPQSYGFVMHLHAIIITTLLPLFSLAVMPLALGLLFITFPQKNYQSRTIAILRALTWMLPWVVGVFFLGTVPEGTQIIREFSKSFAISVIVLPFLLGVAISSILAHLTEVAHVDHGRITKRFRFFRTISLAGLSLVTLYLITQALIPQEDPRIDFTYTEDESGSGTLAWDLRGSQKPHGTFTWQGIVHDINALEKSLKTPWSPVVQVGFSLSSRTLLARKSITIEIRNQTTISNFSLILKDPMGVDVLNADKPYRYLDNSTVEVFIGPYPPENFEVSLDLPQNHSTAIFAQWTEGKIPNLETKELTHGESTMEAHFFRFIGGERP